MNLKEIVPGLWYWTAPHPNWNGATDWQENVGCVYYETPGAAVLIDPLVPRGEEETFWATVDQWVERQGSARILLTAPWHQRSAHAVAERYGIAVWAHQAARGRLSFVTESGPLPEGVELFVPRGTAEGQVAFFLHAARALVVAEFFIGMDGGLMVVASPAQRDRGAFRNSLANLLNLPIDHVLVAHGEPVLHDGSKRIAEALRRDG